MSFAKMLELIREPSQTQLPSKPYRLALMLVNPVHPYSEENFEFRFSVQLVTFVYLRISSDHLVEICSLLPYFRFWLPSYEFGIANNSPSNNHFFEYPVATTESLKFGPSVLCLSFSPAFVP
jgi:hypothetical protein